MVSIKENFEELLESFDYSGNVEERIRLPRVAIGRISNIFYGSELENLRGSGKENKAHTEGAERKIYRMRDENTCWRELTDNLEELRDQIEKLTIRGDVLGK